MNSNYIAIGESLVFRLSCPVRNCLFSNSIHQTPSIQNAATSDAYLLFCLLLWEEYNYIMLFTAIAAFEPKQLHSIQ